MQLKGDDNLSHKIRILFGSPFININTLSIFKLYTLLNLYILIAVLLIANVAHADHRSIQITDTSNNYQLGIALQTLEDLSSAYSIENILNYESPQSVLNWKINDESTPNYGFTDSTYWFKVELNNMRTTESNWIVNVSYPMLDEIGFYLVENDLIISSMVTGDKQVFTQRQIAHRNFLFPLKLDADSTYHLYIRTKSTSAIQLPISLWEHNEFWENEQLQLIIEVLYIGSILILIIYNFVLSLALREKSYLYYVCFSLAMLFFYSSKQGFAYQYLFPNTPYWQDYLNYISISTLCIFSTLFSKNFLSIRTTVPKPFHHLDIFIVISLIILAAGFFLPYSTGVRAHMAWSCFVAIFWLLLGIKEWNRGNSSALLFVVSWGALIVGAIILMMNRSGYIPRSLVSEYSFQIGSIIQVTLISLALAMRIQKERDQKTKAINVALEANKQALQDVARYQRLYLSSMDGIFKCDRNHRFIHANPSMAKILGFDSPETLLDSVDSFMDQFFSRNTGEEYITQLKEMGKLSCYEIEMVTAEGDTLWANLFLRLDSKRNGEFAYEGTLHDITDVVEKEQAEEHRAQATAATEAKSHFLANMSHEIRTPLTAIIGCAESMRDDELSQSEYHYNNSTIIRSGHHLLHVINEILDISKIEANKLDIESLPVDLPGLIAEIGSLLSLRARSKNLAINIQYEFPIPKTITTDFTRLKQILLNLCGNAIKFTDSGGITITVSCDREANEVFFKVTDTGIGLTPSQQERIFNDFTQAESSTSRMHGGTGLGLSIAKRLSEILGGGIKVESEIDVGSTFCFWIATGDLTNCTWITTKQEAGEIIFEGPVDNSTPSLTGNILYAEDNVDNQRLVSMLIKKTGAKITIVQNGVEAMTAALDFDYDLVLMDIQMPIMSGSTAIKMLKSYGFKTPIVAITANLMDYEVKSYIAIGCDDCLAKPIERESFYQVLNRYLPVGLPIEEQMAPSIIDLGGDAAENITALPILSNTVSSKKRTPKVYGQILLVDDNTDNLRLIKKQLELLGATVTTAENGAKAVETAMAGDFNLVLMDVQMPVMNGLDAVSLLRQTGYGRPIYALTANNARSDVKECLDAGYDGHLNKPIEKEILFETVAQHLTPYADKKAVRNKNIELLEDPEFKAIVNRFLERLPNKMAEMAKAREESNWTRLQSLAHELKGTGGSFGYPQLSKFATQLEQCLKQNDIIPATDHLKSLLTSTDEILESTHLDMGLQDNSISH